MDFTDVIDKLGEAERLLLSKILVAGNYTEREYCLQLARALHDFENKIVEEGSSASSKPEGEHPGTPTNGVISSFAETKTSEFPLYFLHEDKLYKVGERRDRPGQLYRKTVPLDDFRSISRTISSLLCTNPIFAMSDIKRKLPGVPDYRLQIVVMSLVEVGTLQVAGRGKYGCGPAGKFSVSSSEQLVKNLPDHFDLI